MKLTTIKDIAKKLGINHSTVSRAINNDPLKKDKNVVIDPELIIRKSA